MDTHDLMKHCTLCPRNCGVDRIKGERGFCGVTQEILVARAALHPWEEPCLSGERGSGTVFFSGCPLGCIFCQNHTIAKGLYGVVVTVKELSEIFLSLEKKGAHNINLVTPTQYIPQIREALLLAKKEDLQVPVVYNSSGYEKASSLKMLEGLISVYLPDFKYMDTKLAKAYSFLPGYKEEALEAIKEMLRQSGPPVFDEEGMLLQGTLVRHLSLPGSLGDSKDVLELLVETFGEQILLSIMNQYTPVKVQRIHKVLNETLSKEDYEELVGYAKLLGIKQAYIQEDGTMEESFIPPFDGEGVL